MAEQIIVIGGGAAGMMAAGQAAARGARVLLLEKNKVLGRKIAITGKGRCNITNVAPLNEFLQNIPGNGRFLYGALTTFSNQDIIRFFEERGLATKVERGGRVFPVTDQAGDVVDVLEGFLREQGVEIRLEEPVREILVAKESGGARSRVTGVKTAAGRTYEARAVILATGGASYPGTGSTGDGYRLAGDLGHTIVPVKPALVPLETAEEWVQELQGLSLRNVEATVWVGNKILARDFGEMLFTHFGVSGPIILTMSRAVVLALEEGRKPLRLVINLKPALTREQVDLRLQRDFTAASNKQFKNSLGELLPKSLIPVIIQLSGIPEDKPVHQITKGERTRFGDLLTGLTTTITKARPIREAIITAGGVSVKEINPKTMASKVVEGLYLAGEVVDVDANTGGFNLQIAWSTGFVAGSNAANPSS